MLTAITIYVGLNFLFSEVTVFNTDNVNHNSLKGQIRRSVSRFAKIFY